MGKVGNQILITGASGFAGIVTADFLLQKGYAVTGTYRSPISGTSFQAVRVDEINAHTDWSEALQGVVGVVHLAARAHQMSDGPEAARFYHQTNVEGTRVLSEQAAAAGVRHFVFISSTKAVITTSTCEVLSEQTPCSPLDPYGVSKYEAEQRVAQIAQASGMAYTILRPPLMYGPGVKGNMATLIRLIKCLPVFPIGGICNSRSLLAVKNLASAIECVLFNESAYTKTYMVSDGEQISTSELARRLAAVFNPSCRVIDMPAFFWRLLQRVPFLSARIDRLAGSLAVDSSLIERETGWQPCVTMHEQLLEML